MAMNELGCAMVVGGGHGAGIAVDAVDQPRVQVFGCFDSVLLCCWLGHFLLFVRLMLDQSDFFY